jgi:hypothetical protein
LNGTREILIYAEDVNTTKKNREYLLQVGLELNTEERKYMIVSSPKSGKKSFTNR